MVIAKSMTKHLTTCCNAPYGVGGERSTHWYLCSACGKPTDMQPVWEMPDDEEPPLP